MEFRLPSTQKPLAKGLTKEIWNLVPAGTPVEIRP